MKEIRVRVARARRDPRRERLMGYEEEGGGGGWADLAAVIAEVEDSPRAVVSGEVKL